MSNLRWAVRARRPRPARFIPWIIAVSVACGDPLRPVASDGSLSNLLIADEASSAAVAIDDVIGRVLPALEPGGSTLALQAAFKQTAIQLQNGNQAGLGRALREALKALSNYREQAALSFHPDVDAASLAVLAAGKAR